MSDSTIIDKPFTELTELEEEQQNLADEICMAFFNLTPDITEKADCADIAHEAAAFFAYAGMPRELHFGELHTAEEGEKIILRPHYWLELPLRDTKIIVDLTLPYWLTDPDAEMTNFDIPTVLIKKLSDHRGRIYHGEQIDFPELVGQADSSAISLYPECRFCDGLIRNYERLK
ncbi:hypothetical protein [Vreelandella massiliensis]|uniref:hypothetical protein n=1 Tax=Vreelandella massiliensis TaxID=1816686 RepID=UPI00096A5FBB|nr:hypothetical protein [Halomonas massiliensis]